MRLSALARGGAILALSGFALSATGALAQDKVVRIGVLNDLTSINADAAGPGSVASAELAAARFMEAHPDWTVEVISADHQNKPDVGAAIAQRWLDQGEVDAIADLPTSSVALAVNEVVRGTDVALLGGSAASSDLTGKSCSPNAVKWGYDSWALAAGAGRFKTGDGPETWFFITPDYTFGHNLEIETGAVVEANGGEVVGAVRHPFNTPDFSSYLLQAQGSGADVIALANTSGDFINAMKQAAEFGVNQTASVIGLLVFVNDIQALGLEAAQGLNVVSSFYWNYDEGTRAYADAFAEKMDGARPSMSQAAVFSATLAYLDAVAESGSTKALEVVKTMKSRPIEDPLFGPTEVRADGRALHRMFLFKIKTPEESEGPWDFYEEVAMIPADEAFRPLSEGGCPLAAE